MLKILKRIMPILILVHVILLGYFLLFKQYFQQDEWHGFGIIMSYGIKYITVDKSIVELLLGDRVGARFITFSLFNFFHLNPLPYGFFALAIHLLNTYLVFLLTKKLIKISAIATLASFFFLINELGHEAYSWFGTMAGSAVSVSLFLTSLLVFIKFVDTKRIKFAIASTILLWISFLFKEVAAFAFILYPVIFLIRSQQKLNMKIIIKNFSPFIVLGIIMIIFFAKTVLFISGDRANYINTGGSLIPSLATHSIQYPIEGIVQLAIPNLYLFKLSDKVTSLINPNFPLDSLDFLIASQNKNAEITILALFLLLGLITVLLIRKIKMSQELLDTLKISIILSALSFLPYIVINRSFSYLDSRHYYLGTIGIAIFLATFIYGLINTNKKLFKIAGILILSFYVLIHESTLFSDFKLMADRSNERQKFLGQVEKLIPVLPKKTVFLINGDSEGYYGLPELKVPFQSGMGHVLMVSYVDKEQLDSDFFKESTFIKALDVGFLYDILGQGYRQVGNQGFGYYYNYSDLQKALDQKLFDEKDVISLYYEHDRMLLKKK